jgi:protein-L-isoaspartate(D-aspartate) O-methyltransferase
MVSALQRSGAIKTEPVRRAFLAIPRELFVPEVSAREGLQAVYRPEVALVTATSITGAPLSSSSAPAVMAPMLEALDLQPGLRVLEIGTGTGYNAALLGWLVGNTGTVISVELEQRFARQAREALAKANSRCQVVVGDGRAGWPAGAPFHRIVVTASVGQVAPEWLAQLDDGGLVELPLRLFAGPAPQAVLTLRRQGRSLRSTSVIPAHFMPLRQPDPADPEPLDQRSVHDL